MAESIIANVITELSKLAVEETKALQGAQGVQGQCTSLMKELKLMKLFLKDAEGKGRDHEAVQEVLDQIREVSFEAEDIVETFVLNTQKYGRRNMFGRAIHAPGHWLGLRAVGEAINDVNKQINKIYEDKAKYEIEMSGEGSSNNPHFENVLRRRRMEVEDEVVGFEDVSDMLIHQLVEGLAHLEVISVVGMGGLGKTTVAKKLYNDKIIRNHFSCVGWVFVSEDYNTREVILGVLKSVGQNTAVLEGLGVNELKEKLSVYLKGHKFIVFLDDVWRKEMWDDVKECFVDKSNGSRIVITSRIAEVARYSSPKEPHFLRFLNQDESWELFLKKAFRGEACPRHLESLGRQIAIRCNGLPLSIVVLGSMLATKDKSERVWEGTLKYVSSFLNQDKVCMEVLALSYRHLPTELKPCFLYFGAFPEDYEVSVRRLIALWLAEGFIQPIGDMPLQDIAESYIEELVDWSLIQVGTRRSDGGIKTCRIHDLLRDLCIREAKRENFFVTYHSEVLEPQSVTSALPSTLRNKHRRVSAHRRTTRFIQSKVYCDPSTIRALMSFDLDQQVSLSSSNWKILCNEFKLLKIMDLGFSVSGGSVPDAIRELMNLRYLRIRITSPTLPSSIFELWNLQMLFIHGSASYVVPKALFKQQQLQQLVIRGRTSLPPCLVLPSNQPLLNLSVLSSIFPTDTFESLVTNGCFPNLIKLSLSNSENNHVRSLVYLFRCLPQLEKLKMSFVDSIPSQNVFEGIVEERHLAQNLKKLTIKSSIWSEKSIDVLGKFPSLQILKLRDVQIPAPADKITAFRSHYNGISTSKDSFPKLITLHLENMKLLGYLKLHENSLLQLRKLYVAQCYLFPFVECKGLWELPNLQDAQFVRANSYSFRGDCRSNMEKLKAQTKCRILVHYSH